MKQGQAGIVVLLSGPARRRQLSEARGVIALIGRDSGAASLAELAAAWRRDAATLSRNPCTSNSAKTATRTSFDASGCAIIQ